MGKFFNDYVFTLNGSCYILFVSVLILSTLFIVRPDLDGYEVVRVQTTGFACKRVVAQADDQTVAICTTIEDCNRICDKYLNTTK